MQRTGGGRNRSRRFRPLGVFAVAALILMLLLAAWWKAANSVPEIVVPTPKLPVPNAHDDLIIAANQITGKVDQAISTPTHTGMASVDHTFTPAEKAAIVAAN